MRNAKASRLALAAAAALAFVSLAFGSIFQAANAQGQEGLFVSVSAATLDQAVGVDPTIIRSRLITINWDMINALDAGSQKTSVDRAMLTLNLFPDSVFRALPDRREVRSPTSFSWFGRIEGVRRSQVTLVIENGLMVGNIRVADSYFQVRYVGADLHVVRQIDESRFPQDGEPLPVYIPPWGTLQDFGIAAADDGSTVDVMVVYTPAARAAAGGSAAMNALIDLAVSETNMAYSRSGVIPRVRLVHAEEVAYTESGTFLTDLDRLRNPSDGFMDNVHPLRNAHGADLVSLIIEGTSLCGIAYLMLAQSNAFEAFAFSVVARICATGNYSFGHELGHNMGLQHDRADAPADGVFPFSHGYVDIPHNFRDIMGTQTSCITCVRIQNFSNPDVTFNGFPTGAPQSSLESADAAASLNATAFTVANWRAQVDAPWVAVDFDGDGKSDIGIYRNGIWYILHSSDGVLTAVGLGGAASDIPVSADYDGDGKADEAVYRNGIWFILRSSDGVLTAVGLGGVSDDVPVPADYDGDGRTDEAIYRNGIWYIFRSSDGVLTSVGLGGVSDDVPVPADYDGDGRTDEAIYRNGIWYIFRSSDGVLTSVGLGGAANDIPVPADYDGDGETDQAVYRSGIWFIRQSSNEIVTAVGLGGVSGDVPVPADYDGDGRTDEAIYRNGIWYILRSSDGVLTAVGLGGLAEDIPLN
jgi:hypothetical protein